MARIHNSAGPHGFDFGTQPPEQLCLFLRDIIWDNLCEIECVRCSSCSPLRAPMLQSRFR